MIETTNIIGKIKIGLYAVLFISLAIILFLGSSDKTITVETALTPLYLICVLSLVSGDFDLRSTPAYGVADDPFVRNGAVFLVSLLVWILPFFLPQESLGIGYISIGMLLLFIILGIQRLVEIGIHARVKGIMNTLPLCLFSLGELLIFIPLLFLGSVLLLMVTFCFIALIWNPTLFAFCSSLLIPAFLCLSPLLLVLFSFVLTQKGDIRNIHCYTRGKSYNINITFARRYSISRIHEFLETLEMRTIIDFIILGFIYLGLYVKLGTLPATIGLAILLGINDWIGSRKMKSASVST